MKEITKLELALAGVLFLILLEGIHYFTAPDRRMGHAFGSAALPMPRQVFREPSKQHDGRLVLRSVVVRKQPAIVVAPTAGLNSQQSPRTASQEAIPSSDEGDVSIPLAFLTPPRQLVATDEQVAEFDSLRQQFIELMGGPNQDPADPEYRRRWQDAQQQIDDRFMAFFGSEAFNQQQLRAVRESGQPSG